MSGDDRLVAPDGEEARIRLLGWGRIRWPRFGRECDHVWRYDEEESAAGPWTGYMERCEKCGMLQQVPQ